MKEPDRRLAATNSETRFQLKGLIFTLMLCALSQAVGRPKPDKQLSYVSIGAVDQRAVAKMAAMLRRRGIDTWGDSEAGMFDVRVPLRRRREGMRLVRIGARKYGYYYVDGSFHIGPHHRSRMESA